MAKTKRFFLSDIHLSSQELYDLPGKPAWYDPAEHGPRLLGFIDKHVLAKPERVKDVVLLGDVFNTWVCPVNVSPPTYEEIMAANQPVLEKFREIVQAGVNLFLIQGNHDYDLPSGLFEAEVPDSKAIRFYRSGRIHAEHGHAQDIYNAPDYVSDPAFGRPIGYPISRCVTTGGGTGHGILDLPAYLDDILEAAVTSQNIFSTIIEAVAERANLGPDDTIEMPGGRLVTITELMERYARLAEVYSASDLLRDLYDRRYLHARADRLCKQLDVDIIVFGHTHNAVLDKDFFLVSDRIYANTGSWCKPNAYCVEIDKSNNPSVPVKVRLHKVGADGEITGTETKELGGQ